MTAAPFAAGRYVLATPETIASSLVIEPLLPETAERLGRAFAAIDPWASYPYPPAALTGYFAAHEPGAPRFAVMLGGGHAGCLGLRLNWLHGPYVQFLGILPDYQRRGLGHAVLDWVESEARGGGARNLWVAATDFNEGALRFYQRHGFMPVAPLPGLVREGRTEVLLRKRL